MTKHKYPLLGLLITGILLFVYFGQFYINANHLSFAPWGDGYKNYYTIAYYLKNDCGSHFSGMNYPYGENVIYTDNQPLLAWVLKPICSFFPGLVQYLKGILVWLLLVSHLVAYLFTYKTLRVLNLTAFFSALFAIFITLLAPQLIRLNGHFSLGYTCYLPVVIYLLIRLQQTGFAYKYLAALCIVITCATFLHPYYFAMSALLILSLMAVSLLRRNTYKVKLSDTLKLLIPVVLPFAVFKLYLIVTDHVADRPNLPWGFVESRSTIADILLHPGSFIYQGLAQIMPVAKIAFHFEGQAYIGIVTIAVLTLLIINMLAGLLRKNRLNIQLPIPISNLLLASVPVLLFAMAFPFSINHWFEGWLDFFPSAIKQFRASGRFSWVFYYTASIVTAVVLHNLYLQIKNRKAAYAFIFMALSIWFVDFNMVNNYNKKMIGKWSSDLHEDAEMNDVLTQLKQHHYNASDFQAILPLPFYLNGSEKLYIESNSAVSSMELSLYTGLPIACGQMSRTSREITFNIANLMSESYIKKDILSLYNKKPLLLFSTNQDISANESNLINKATFLFNSNGISYYKLPLSAFNDSVEDVKLNISKSYNRLINHGNYLSFDTLDNVVLKTFDNDGGVGFAGEGGLYSKAGNVWMYGDTLPNAVDDSWYEVSAWFYADNGKPAFPVIYFTQTDPQGNAINSFDINGKFSTNTYGKWVRASAILHLTNKHNKLFASGDGQLATYDELMIRPTNTTVISHYKDSHNFTYNNFPIY